MKDEAMITSVLLYPGFHQLSVAVFVHLKFYGIHNLFGSSYSQNFLVLTLNLNKYAVNPSKRREIVRTEEAGMLQSRVLKLGTA